MANVTDSAWHWAVSTFTTTVKQWMCFSCSVPLLLVSAIKNTSTTATTRYLLSWNTYSWSPLISGSYSWVNATIWYVLSPWTYTICNDSWWSSYNNKYASPSPAYTQVKTNITWVSGWWSNTWQWLDIESITTDTVIPWNNNNFLLFL